MRRIITILTMMFFMTGYVSAQEKDKEEVIISHTVELGETVLLICKKYVVLPNDFYKYNKEAIHGIRPNEVLRIPLHKSKKKNAIEAFSKKEESAYAKVSNPPARASAKE